MATRHLLLPDEVLERSAKRATAIWTFIIILAASASAGWAVHAYGSSFERKTLELERRVGDTENDMKWLKAGVWALLQKSGITDIEPPP